MFGASSAACAYATSSGALIAARACLGLGAAAILPLSLSVLPVFFTEQERPKALAVIMAATFIGYPVGPLLGGWLLDNYWWGSVFLINVPVVALGAVAVLMPESRAGQRPGLDPAGTLVSSLGLAGLTYGFIKAGQDGWSNTVALAAVIGGVAMLAGFVAWERRLARHPSAQPLVDLALFRSAGFAWGSVLVAMVTFALFGILFAMPQYFQDVRGLDAFGSGLRLLSVIGGLVIGMLSGTRLQSPRRGHGDPPGRATVSAKWLATIGFAAMAIALAAGTTTKVTTTTGYTATWFALAGLGLGLALPTAMNAALGALTADHSGAGSALISAIRQVGATTGVAILGTVLASAYRSHLNITGLPPQAGSTARSTIAGGIVAARASGSAVVLTAVRTAFVHALDTMLWVCASTALTAALLALTFLPHPPPDELTTDTEMPAPAQITS